MKDIEGYVYLAIGIGICGFLWALTCVIVAVLG